uniref:Uncharacterized protein n=1 Tax=Rhizophora mucronata TaxID=61149 RepID=A0A2P2M940_RHIMU
MTKKMRERPIQEKIDITFFRGSCCIFCFFVCFFQESFNNQKKIVKKSRIKVLRGVGWDCTVKDPNVKE